MVRCGNSALIGLFGGAFDPIHFGHLRPALEIKELLSLDEIRFMPLHQAPHKHQPQLPAEQRLSMLERAIAQEPEFVVETCELERGGISWSIDSMLELRQRYGDQQPLVMLLGTDAFAGLPQWKRWEEILQLTNIVVMQRPDAPLESHLFPEGYLQHKLAATATQLKQSICGKVLSVEVTQLDISSTKIRELMKVGRSVRYLMPDITNLE